MTKINYKSDFDFILKLKDGADPKKTVPFPEGDFDARFWTSNKANAYTASYRDGVYTNCFRTEDGGMHFVFDDHRMGKGALHWEPHFELPNDIYPDNMQDLYRKAALDIELVDGDGDCPTTAELEAILPYIKGPKGDKGDKGDKGNKGDAFTYDDFTPEQIEGLQRPATEAAQRLQEFQTTAEANESEREEAEEKRAEEFADWEAEIDSKADRSELSNVFAEEPLTPDNFPDIDTYTREELKKDLFIDKWKARISLYFSSETRDIDGYDASTDEFILNGLRFSYADALMIYICSVTIIGQTNYLYMIQTLPVKTLFWPLISMEYGKSLSSMFIQQSNLEILQIQSGFSNKIYARYINRMFEECTRLREIRGIIDLSAAKSASENTAAFKKCFALEEVRLSKIMVGINFSDSPNLSRDSISYMITNAANTADITITVHPDVFAKLTDESNPEWHPLLALAAEKNISFTTV